MRIVQEGVEEVKASLNAVLGFIKSSDLKTSEEKLRPVVQNMAESVLVNER